MDSLPNADPAHSAAVSVSSNCSSSDRIAKELQKTYPEVFSSNLGLYKFLQATLRLKKNAKPVFRPKRPVPYAAIPKFDRLEANGVISKVNYSEWAAPIVVVRKSNGSLRICADFSTGLNDALDLHQYPIPLPEDIFATLTSGQYFSHIDFADAYLQIEMDQQSKQLLTINTHRGLYQYNRLPFGVKSAPAIFQQNMDTILAGLPGVVAYLDDVIVVGRTEEEHRRNLHAAFRRIAESGLHVRMEKCRFATSSINYLGYIIDKHGRRPDSEKIEAITKMPVPQEISQLRSFLGLLSYYGTFIKEMRSLRAPLDALLAKNAKFN
uniref:Reverse transcriptase domain-containing protein n=1 Tax=Haemonchus contortus TaxID=6289 RepID=A0A7I4YQM1_HAECO|nr:RNA-directed DNA polymerase (reverse transcriptase) domain containing protein [Haemonchus contortus]